MLLPHVFAVVAILVSSVNGNPVSFVPREVPSVNKAPTNKSLMDPPFGSRRDDNETPSAICGANSLYESHYESDCRLEIYRTDSNGVPQVAGYCSAAIISPRLLVTAGHCVYKASTGFNYGYNLYCGGNAVCGTQRDAYITRVFVPSKWIDNKSDFSSEYDAAIIATNVFLPYSPYGFQEISCTGSAYCISCEL